MTNEIKNCEFHFKCPLRWEDLKQTGATDSRFCGVCGKTVHFAYTQPELDKLSRKGDCVAVFSENMPERIFSEPKELDLTKESSVTMGVYIETIKSEPIPGITCPNCVNINPLNSKYCARCGTKLSVENS